MKLYRTDQITFPLPDRHRFPVQKYALLYERLKGLGDDRLVFEDAPAATDEEILRAHTASYLQRLTAGELAREEVRDLGLPWSPELLLRSRHSAGATVAACRTALEEGIAVNLAGGTHHAGPERPAGYCVFNDAVIAARAMQAEDRCTRVAVIDTDAHQGDGTASIAAADPSIFTFSIHGAKNYPFRKVASDLDIALPDGTEESHYLESLDRGIRRVFAIADPELVIYLSGADPFEGDRFSRFRLPKHALEKRDRLVLNVCTDRKTPVAVAMAGGYAREIVHTVDIHESTVRISGEYWDLWNR